MRQITEFLTGTSPVIYMFIFFGKLIEVSLATLRSQLILKGQRLPGAAVAALEYLFWLSITASVMNGFANDPTKVVVLVLAFALGQIVGSSLEERMALGYCTMIGIFSSQVNAYEAADAIRKQGQAVTILHAEGLERSVRTTLLITTKRKALAQIQHTLFEVDPNTIVSIHPIQFSNSKNLAAPFK